MCPERSSWKEGRKDGHKRDYSTLAGRTSINVKLASRRKAQKSTGFTTVQSDMKSGGKFQRLAESVNKRRPRQRKSGSGKEEKSNTLSESQRNRGNFRMKIWESGKHHSWCMKVGGFWGHVATDGSLPGPVAGPWCSLIMMRIWGRCMGCVARWRQH